MTPYLTAQRLICDVAKIMDVKEVSIYSATNKICAENIKSSETIPPFDNSAMDGFAVCAEDTKDATSDNPIKLKIKCSIAAGDRQYLNTTYEPKTACEIMTGAPIPNGYDAVIRVEDIVKNKKLEGQLNCITINRPAKIKENLRYAGEDFAKGNTIITKGTFISGKHIMALAAAGIQSIKVYKKPKIAIICTGKELVDDLNTPLQKGQIRNSNLYYLRSTIPAFTADVCSFCTIPDKEAIFQAILEKMQSDSTSPDIIISTGAVSQGKWDFIPTIMQKLGATLIFHKVAIKPGKPILFAKLANGTYYFGLPGNPISTVVGLRFFVYTLIRELQKLPKEKPIVTTINTSVDKKEKFRYFYKAFLHVNDTGMTQLKILNGQESFKINSLLKANCMAVLEENKINYQPNDKVAIYPLDPYSFPNT